MSLGLERGAPGEEALDLPVQPGVGQGGGAPLQGGDLPALAAEGQQFHTAQPQQQRHAPPGEPLRRGGGVGEGQFHHQIHPGEEGGPGPDLLWEEGGAAPLEPVSPHHRHHRLGPCPPGGLGQEEVAVMEGVVFGDDACDAHGGLLLFFGGIVYIIVL